MASNTNASTSEDDSAECWADRRVEEPLTPKQRELLNQIPLNWRELILGDDSTFLSLKNAVFNFLQEFGENPNCFPKKKHIFRAMKYCGPSDVKVIIVGHDPIFHPERASGLAFSYPGKWKGSDTGNSAVYKLLGVLKNVGFLDQGQQYSYCNKQWATRGVLLWNSSLTITSIKVDEKAKHWKIWGDFTKNILLQIIKKPRKNKELFTLCWGTFAEKVGLHLIKGIPLRSMEDLRDELKESDVLYMDGDHVHLYIGHHPTFPKDGKGNKFNEQARIQFEHIKRVYGDLFAPPSETDVSETDYLAQMDSLQITD